jgi:hypothetical protein
MLKNRLDKVADYIVGAFSFIAIIALYYWFTFCEWIRLNFEKKEY